VQVPDAKPYWLFPPCWPILSAKLRLRAPPPTGSSTFNKPPFTTISPIHHKLSHSLFTHRPPIFCITSLLRSCPDRLRSSFQVSPFCSLLIPNRFHNDVFVFNERRRCPIESLSHVQPTTNQVLTASTEEKCQKGHSVLLDGLRRVRHW